VRKRARAEAEAIFRVAQNTHNFESNQRTAIDLYSKVKGVEVIATNTGIIVAETVPGARELAASHLPNWRETPCEPDDVPGLIRKAAIARYSSKADRLERAPRDFRYRVAERDFLAAMKGPQVHSIAHFKHEPDAPITYPPPPSEPGRYLHQRLEEDDRPKPDPQPETPLSEWRLGHGFGIVTDK
jgi:hypothetical protein